MAIVANALLIKFEGGWTGVGDVEDIGVPPGVGIPGLGHPYGRRVEGMLTTNARSQYEAQVLGVSSMVLSVAEVCTVGIEPRGGDEPYIDFGLGDYIDVTDSTGTTTVHRDVWAIGVSTDELGEVIYTPEINALKIEPVRSVVNRQKVMGGPIFATPDPGDSASPDNEADKEADEEEPFDPFGPAGTSRSGSTSDSATAEPPFDPFG